MMESPPSTEPLQPGEENQDEEPPVPTPKPPALSRRGKYISKACNECKRRKSKCNGRQPCNRCAHHSITCIYASHGRQSRRAAKTEELQQLRREIATLNRQLDAQPKPTAPPTVTAPPAPNSIHAIENEPSPTCQPSPSSWRSFEYPPQQVQQQQPQIPDPPPSLSQRQGSSNVAFNFRLAQTNLDAMGISPPSQSGELQDGLPDQPLARLQMASPSTDPLWLISRQEALRLVSVYEEEIGIMYPFLDIGGITAHVDRLYRAMETGARCGFAFQALPGADIIAEEDLQIVKMVLASAYIIETSGSSQRGQEISAGVKATVQAHIWTPVTVRRVEIFTLLAIYEFLSDRDLLAWRFIGIVARWCLELGLNQSCTLEQLFPNEHDRKFAIRLFWCIHTLDRRWGFGTGLPFALQNDDIDATLPEPDDEVPYLKAMVAYSRIGSKVWSATYSARGASTAPPPPVRRDDVGYLDYLITHWTDSLPPSLRLPPSESSETSPPPPPSRGLQRLQLLLHLRAGHMKILLYQPILHSTARLRTHHAQARALIEIARDTIHRLDHLNRTTTIYQTQQMCFNHFLVTSLGLIFLAISLAPAEFSDVVRDEFYLALDLVRSFSGHSVVSQRLWKMIRGLREIGRQLGLSHSTNQLRGSLTEDGDAEPIIPVSLADLASGSPARLPSPPRTGNGAAMAMPSWLGEGVSGIQLTQDLCEMFQTMEQGGTVVDPWTDPTNTTPAGIGIEDIDFSQVFADLF